MTSSANTDFALTDPSVKSRMKATLFLILFVDILGFTVLVPFLPFYSKTLGATPMEFSLMVMSYGAASFVAGPILGALSDRIGRRKVLIFSQLGTFLGLLLISQASSMLMLFLARTLDGFTAGNYSVASAYFSDLSDKKDRTSAFALVGIAFGLGFLGGPALSGVLSQHFGTFFPVYVAAGLSLLSVLGTFFFLKERARPTELKYEPTDILNLRKVFKLDLYSRYLKMHTTAPYLLEIFIFQVGFASFFWGFPLLAADQVTWNGHAFGQAEIGYTYAISGLIGLIIQGGLLRHVARVWGEYKIIWLGFIALILGYFLMGQTHTVQLFLVCIGLLAFGHASLRPSISASLTFGVKDEEQGAVLGVSQSAVALAQIIGPVFGGLFLQSKSYALWGTALSALMVLGIFVHFFYAKNPDQLKNSVLS